MQTLIEDLALQRKRTKQLRGEEVQKVLRFQNLFDLLTPSPGNVILSSQLDSPVEPTTHSRLIEFLKERNLGSFGLKSSDRVGIAIPQGPELVVCILLTVTYCTCAPINPSGTEEEIRYDLRNLGAKAVIVLDDPSNSHICKAAQSLLIDILFLQSNGSSCGLFSLTSSNSASPCINIPSKPEDVAIVLHTSGTTGTKKVVPISLLDLCVGAICVASSTELKSTDICLNMMPLFHVGGIIRNIFAPILSGGAVICTPGVDPILFWDLCKVHPCTWYYAAPTIHMALIEEAKRRERVQHSIRLIINAAGGLLPHIAEELKNTFGAIILPSYGMTECMPISCPPVDYNLEKPGSSGMVIGPELCIMDAQGNPLLANSIGNIMIRGCPVMHGYENNSQANQQSFSDGWFNTGDLGYLDQDGYLYITGRSKEVINRGGEIISPFDIEDVVVTHPSVKEVVAFAIPHNKLQETIGIAVVIKPGKKRFGLKGLHKFIGEKLHPSKWPQAIVFMDSLVKTNTNKAQRVGLASRMNLPELTDQKSELQRLFEAKSPTAGAQITIPIETKPIAFALEIIDWILMGQMGIHSCNSVRTENHKLVTYVELVGESERDDMKSKILEYLRKELPHEYMVPDSVVLMEKSRTSSRGEGDSIACTSSTLEEQVAEVMASILQLDTTKLRMDVDFFEVGGDSIKAGQLIARVRAKFGVPLTTTAVFTYRTITDLATHIEHLQQEESCSEKSQQFTPVAQEIDNSPPLSPQSQSSIQAMLIQLLPFVFLFPIRRSIIWFCFMNLFALGSRYVPPILPDGRLITLILALITTKLCRKIFFPILFILLKWVILYKYQPGKYPLWSSYYLRWWIVDQLRKLMGRGIFKMSNWSLILYYKLLGAKIGTNVNIDANTTIAEYDLIEIGDHCRIEKDCLFRPFTAESGTMILARIEVGKGSQIREKAALAPGSHTPKFSTVFEMSSSYEITPNNPTPIQNNKPHVLMILFFGLPLLFIVEVATFMPVYGVLYFMGTAPWKKSVENWVDAVEWFVLDGRVLVYLLMRPVYEIVCPVIRLGMGILLKWIIVGRFKEGPVEDKQWTKFRYWLMPRLLGNGRFFGVIDIIGSHYEGVSFIYRILGSKIGKQIYWPGSGISVVEYDLFEVEDHVVFGSRSRIKFTSNYEAKKVVFKRGANIADRCFIMPGVTVGEGAVLGSGTFAPTNTQFLPKSVWVGSTCGSPECLFKGEVTPPEIQASPFGEAFYERRAPYFVLPLCLLIPIHFSWLVFVSIFKGFPVIGTLLFISSLYRSWRDSLGILFGLYICVFTLLQLSSSLLALLIDVVAKWVIIGLRQPGNYSWNESSYCQRWQFYLMIQHISTRAATNGLLRFLQGSIYLVWYFRALGCRIGKNVCLYPTGGDPMMTEPDLVTLGDNVAINNASVIAHINSRGNFKLNRIRVGKNSTLRSFSRLLSGAEMGEGAKLLEHTLVMGGDKVAPHTIVQGWPARSVGETHQQTPAFRTVDL